MLTDIFSRRYANRKLWSLFGEKERRLLVQGFRMLDEQICPYYINGKESESGKAYWKDIQSRLSMELGLPSLSPLAYAFPSTWNGKSTTQTGMWTLHKVCENWFMSPLNGGDANRYIQERLSLIEIGFRKREDQLKKSNTESDAKKIVARQRLAMSGSAPRSADIGEGMSIVNAMINSVFQASVEELNARFL